MNVRDKLLCKRMGYSKDILRSNDKTSGRSEKELKCLLDVKRKKKVIRQLKWLRGRLEKAGVRKEDVRRLLEDCAKTFYRFDMQEDLKFVFEEERISKMDEQKAEAMLLGEML